MCLKLPLPAFEVCPLLRESGDEVRIGGPSFRFLAEDTAL